MDLISVCLYLRQKGMNATDIHKNIEATLGPSAICYSTINKSLREDHVTHHSELIPILIEDEGQRHIDEAILLALAG
jgi:hypothetical protein